MQALRGVEEERLWPQLQIEQGGGGRGDCALAEVGGGAQADLGPSVAGGEFGEGEMVAKEEIVSLGV